jgi:hypothetical protein
VLAAQFEETQIGALLALETQSFCKGAFGHLQTAAQFEETQVGALLALETQSFYKGAFGHLTNRSSLRRPSAQFRETLRLFWGDLLPSFGRLFAQFRETLRRKK